MTVTAIIAIIVLFGTIGALPYIALMIMGVI